MARRAAPTAQGLPRLGSAHLTPAGAQVLDLGCGQGDIAIYLACRGLKVRCAGRPAQGGAHMQPGHQGTGLQSRTGCSSWGRQG